MLKICLKKKKCSFNICFILFFLVCSVFMLPPHDNSRGQSQSVALPSIHILERLFKVLQLSEPIGNRKNSSAILKPKWIKIKLHTSQVLYQTGSFYSYQPFLPSRLTITCKQALIFHQNQTKLSGPCVRFTCKCK